MVDQIIVGVQGLRHPVQIEHPGSVCEVVGPLLHSWTAVMLAQDFHPGGEIFDSVDGQRVAEFLDVVLLSFEDLEQARKICNCRRVERGYVVS